MDASNSHNQADPAGAPASRDQWRALFDRRHFATTAMLCLGVALYAFNGFLVTTALPSAVMEFGGVRLIAWAVTLYLVASIVAGAAAALLKQAFGARAVLVSAALLFLLGTAVAAAAPNMPVVLLGRVLQGLGEGIIAATCYTLIPEIYPSALIARVFGVEAAVWAAAAFGGPALAGLITEAISWRAAFLVNIPLILLFATLALKTAPGRARTETSHNKQDFSLPAGRLLLVSAGLLAVLAAGIAPPGGAAVLAGTGVTALVLTVLIDGRRAKPMLPRQPFSLSSTLGLALWTVLLMPVAQAVNGVYLPFALQRIWTLGPTAAGALAALMAISWSLVAILVAGVEDPARQRLLIRLGPGCQIAGMGCAVYAIESGMIAPIFAAQMLIGSGFGLCWGLISKLAMEASGPAERDKTSGLLPTLQSAGYALGGGIAGLAANNAGLSALAAGPEAQGPLTVAYAVAGLIALPGLFAATAAARPGRT